MANVQLKNINKIYDNNVQAVFDFNLDIADKEFIVFVGPSGCGKSTTLRMIAGLEDISSGELYIDGRFSNDLEPKNRDISMVFQNYALYPHMTVYANLAFGLRNKKVPMPKIDFKAYEASLVSKGMTKEEIAAEMKRAKAERTGCDEFVVFDIDKKRLSSLEKEKKDLEKFAASIQKAIASGDRSQENLLPEIAAAIKQIDEEHAYYEANKKPVYEMLHLPESEIAKRVHEAAKILDIEQYLKRKPKALSGGQCQRVALGRAIVKKSKVFLMDEPLSNLDAKLRVQMRSELVRLHESIGATTVYVTHDQTEAMTMASRIVVMKLGYIQQIGDPKTIYNHPSNRFVATFIGSPSMNILEGRYANGSVSLEGGYSTPFPAEKAKGIESSIQKKIDGVHSSINELKNILSSGEKIRDLAPINKSFRSIASSIAMLGNALYGDFEGIEELIAPAVKKSKIKFLASKSKGAFFYPEQISEKLTSAEKILAQEEEAFGKGDYKILFGIRPEHISLTKEGGDLRLQSDVVEMMGDIILAHFRLGKADLIAKVSSQNEVESHEEFGVNFANDKIYFFNPLTEEAIY